MRSDLNNWWLAQEGDSQSLQRDLFATVKTLETVLRGMRFNSLVYTRVATGRNLPSVYGLQMGDALLGVDVTNFQSPTFNALASCIETLESKVGRNKPWITFATDEADLKNRVRAEQMSRYVDGLFYESDVYAESRTIFTDALTTGTGYLKVYAEGKKVKAERINPDEILVDPQDAIAGNPLMLYQRRFVNKDQLKADFPDHDAEIEKSQTPKVLFGGFFGGTQTLVTVIEAWRRKVGEHKGRHVIATSDCVLVDEPWDTGFPIVPLRFRRVAGWYGQGLAEILLPLQIEVDRQTAVINEGEVRIAVPRVLVDRSSKVDPSTINNRNGGIVPYTDKPPMFVPAPDIGQQLYASRQSTIDWIYKRAGVSDMAAQGQKAQGLTAAVALETQHDFESERFSPLALTYEEYFVEVANKMLEMAALVKPKVMAPGQHVQLIEWDKVALKPDSYEPRAFPISSLPTDPAGRQQKIDNWRANSQISKADYMRLVELPDTGAFVDLVTAARDDVEQALDSIIEDGVYEAPEPYQGLDGEEGGIKQAQARYLKERRVAPAAHVDMLLRWIDEAQIIVQATQPAPAAPAPVAAPPPDGSAPPSPDQGAQPPAAPPPQ